MLSTITILRCYGMACGCVDGWMGRGSRVDGDDGLSPPVPVQYGCPPDLAWCRHTCRAADFFVCGSRSGKGQDQSSWLQTTDSRLQHSMNNEMRGGEQSRGGAR
jgi:hypothetical protein